MSIGYLLVGGVNMPQPPYRPAPSSGIFTDLRGDGVMRLWLATTSDDWAHHQAERLKAPYDVMPVHFDTPRGATVGAALRMRLAELDAIAAQIDWDGETAAFTLDALNREARDIAEQLEALGEPVPDPA